MENKRRQAPTQTTDGIQDPKFEEGIQDPMEQKRKGYRIPRKKYEERMALLLTDKIQTNKELEKTTYRPQ